MFYNLYIKYSTPFEPVFFGVYKNLETVQEVIDMIIQDHVPDTAPSFSELKATFLVSDCYEKICSDGSVITCGEINPDIVNFCAGTLYRIAKEKLAGK